MRLTISDAGLSLLKEFEGCKLTAYQDVAGKWTIGYGHTGPAVVKGLTWTQAQVDAALKSDLAFEENVVNNLITVYLAQPCFDALVSFVHNTGAHAFTTSTLLHDLNAGSLQAAAKEFLRWTHAGGQVVPGLLRRREAEAELFRTGIPA